MATPNLETMNAGWYFRFKLPGQAQRRLRIGRIEHMSEAEARRKAAILYGQCLQGIDVFAERAASAQPALPTSAPKPILLGDAVEAFRAMFSADWKPTTARNYETWLGNLSDLQDVPVAQIINQSISNFTPSSGISQRRFF